MSILTQSSTRVILDAGGDGGCTRELLESGQQDGKSTQPRENSLPREFRQCCAVTAVLFAMCYIQSQNISLSDTARKSPVNPKVLESYNNPWSTPSSTKGAQQCSQWPARDTLHAVCSVFKESGNSHRGWFQCLHGHLALLCNRETNTFGSPNEIHNAGMRPYKTSWSFQSIHLFQWLKTKFRYQCWVKKDSVLKKIYILSKFVCLLSFSPSFPLFAIYKFIFLRAAGPAQ